MRLFRNRIAVFLPVIAAAAGIAVLAPASASADTVTVRYICGLPGVYAGNDQIQVTLNAPANAARGQTVQLTVSMIGQAYFPNGARANANTATLDLILGGASSGTITATGLTNPDIPPGGNEVWNGGHAQATLANVGNVTYTPGKITATFNGVSGYMCAAQPVVPVAATTRVS